MKRKFPVIALLAVSCGLYLNAEAAKNGGVMATKIIKARSPARKRAAKKKPE